MRHELGALGEQVMPLCEFPELIVDARPGDRPWKPLPPIMGEIHLPKLQPPEGHAVSSSFILQETVLAERTEGRLRSTSEGGTSREHATPLFNPLLQAHPLPILCPPPISSP